MKYFFKSISCYFFGTHAWNYIGSVLDNNTGRRIKIKECEYCKQKEYMPFEYED